MKYLVVVILALSLGTLAQAKTKKRVVASIDAAKCELVAKESARKILKNEDSGSGLNEDAPVKFLALNNGGVYVVSGWIQKVFDWEVIVVVNGACEVQSSTLN